MKKITFKKYNREIKIAANGKIEIIKHKRIAKKKLTGNRHSVKKIWLGALLVYAVAGLIAIGMFAFRSVVSYAITVDGQQVCCLETEQEAKEVIKSVIKNYTKEGTTTKLFKINADIEVEPTVDFGKSEKVNVQTATDCITNDCFQNNGIIVEVCSYDESEEVFEPEPTYVKDKEKLAGETRVESEAVNGKHIVRTCYYTENGTLVDAEIYEKKVIDPGTPAVIHKGVLGLPEGEDWKTYSGDPVFQDGEELIKTAETYKGLKYKYGGNSLTKGVDCVTFVWNMYKLYGINLKCSHSGLQHAGKEVSLDKAQKGDIICYYGHVALYMGDGKIIHASPKTGVHVSNNVKYRKIKTIRRVIGKGDK